jgi:RNA polymerase sigma factor (sigma-70 family)
VRGDTAERQKAEGPDIVRERSNEEWLRELRLPDPGSAVVDLRELLVRKLRMVFRARGDRSEGLTEDTAQEALLKILANLDTFRGESRFTTWAVRIAVNLALTELRRRHWRNVSLDGRELPDLRFDPEALRSKEDDPERAALKRALLESVNRAVADELTDRQRKAIIAIVFRGIPPAEVAGRLGTNRNALYKLLHDARKRLKRAMLAGGLSEGDIRTLMSS